MTCVLLLSYSHHTSQATLSQYAFNMDVDEALPPPPRDPSPSPVSDPEEGRHEDDLRAAAGHGLKTVYVRRPTEDVDVRDGVKSKAEGGEVDVVVASLEELVGLL